MIADGTNYEGAKPTEKQKFTSVEGISTVATEEKAIGAEFGSNINDANLENKDVDPHFNDPSILGQYESVHQKTKTNTVTVTAMRSLGLVRKIEIFQSSKICY